MAQQERKTIFLLYLVSRLRVRGAAPVPLIRRNSEPYLMKPIDIYTITDLVLKSTISVPYGSKRALFKVILRFFFDKKKEFLQILKSASPCLNRNAYLWIYRKHIEAIPFLRASIRSELQSAFLASSLRWGGGVVPFPNHLSCCAVERSPLSSYWGNWIKRCCENGSVRKWFNDKISN